MIGLVECLGGVLTSLCLFVGLQSHYMYMSLHACHFMQSHYLLPIWDSGNGFPNIKDWCFINVHTLI